MPAPVRQCTENKFLSRWFGHCILGVGDSLGFFIEKRRNCVSEQGHYLQDFC